MTKIIECVPNFSEGKDERIISAIVDAIKNTPGCTVLDVDSGKSTNRTVITFVGNVTSIVDGAFNAAKKAYELIDMRKHKGEHPRMGALDVCPFVPVANVTTEECVECAKQFGKRLGEELGVPVYLYEDAQPLEYRKSLKQIRAGEYEGLEEKLKQPEWKPDFGPATFVPHYGATVTGSRFFLIAYNVNILGTKEQANRIAFDLREQGRGSSQPGKLKSVKGIGWWVEEYNLAQVSMNLDNYTITGIHTAFEEVKRVAKEINVGVLGSEIVGLIPLQSILDVADYYIKQENLFIIEESQKIRLAVERLGLNSVAKFDPKLRIIEYMMIKPPTPLVDSSIRNFVDAVSARTSAPGGGSVSALCATLGAALGTMVGWLTYGKRKFEKYENFIREAIPPLHNAQKKLIEMIDADSNAFNQYITALKLPSNTTEQKAAREQAMQDGLKAAIRTPFSVMLMANECWPSLHLLAKYGNIASISDIQVGAKILETGIWGAHKNILINLENITDEEWKNKTKITVDDMLEYAQKEFQKIIEEIENRPKEEENESPN